MNAERRTEETGCDIPPLSFHPPFFLPSREYLSRVYLRARKRAPFFFPSPSSSRRPSPFCFEPVPDYPTGLYDPPRSVGKGEGKPVASNGSDKKFSRSPRSGDKVVHSSPSSPRGWNWIFRFPPIAN